MMDTGIIALGAALAIGLVGADLRVPWGFPWRPAKRWNPRRGSRKWRAAYKAC